MDYNLDLVRVGKCKHKKGKPNLYFSMETLFEHKHTGELTIQVWTARDDDAEDMPGWACIHEKSLEEDKKKVEAHYKQVERRSSEKK